MTTMKKVPPYLTYFSVSLLAIGCLSVFAWVLSGQPAQAQTSPPGTVEDPLAVEDVNSEDTAKILEVLIGNAVSLSNRSYPEVEKAIQRFKNNDMNGALEFLKQAKTKYPQLPPAYIILAKLNVMAKNTQGAYNILELQAAEDPQDPEAYLLLADQAFAANRTAESEALFEKADRLVKSFEGSPKRKKNLEIRSLAGQAAILERRGKWEQAHDLLEQWVEMDPDNAMSHARLGVTLFHLDKSKDAYNQFAKARELNPNLPHPYASLGQLFTQNDDMKNAKRAFEQAYAEDKADPTTVRTYAEWLLQQGELEKAQEVATELRKLTPDSAVAVLLDGVVALMRDQTDRAEEAFMKVLSIDPRNARANDLLALMLIESDNKSDRERALSYAEINTDRYQNNPQANITKAYVLYKLGRMQEAEQPLQIGMRGQLQNDSAFLIAKMMVEQNQKEKAVSALEQMLQNKQGLFVFRHKAEELLNELKTASSE